MEKLLDLIFDNLFFVILILGGIWNFISRMTKGEATQGAPKKKPFLDDLGDVLKDFLPADKDKEEEKHQQERKQPTVVHKQRQEPLEAVPYVNEFEKKRQELETLKKQEQVAFERVQTMNQMSSLATQTGKKGFALNVKEIGKEDIAKGVIWSEVLGKPRALNPHRHSKRQV